MHSRRTWPARHAPWERGRQQLGGLGGLLFFFLYCCFLLSCFLNQLRGGQSKVLKPSTPLCNAAALKVLDSVPFISRALSDKWGKNPKSLSTGLD